MSNEPQERLILLRLALEGGEVKNTEFKPELKKPDRERLTKAGLIEAENRRPADGGRTALHLALTERGWGWLAEHLDGELPPQAKPAKTLQKFLACLKDHLDTRGYSLADFITVRSTTSPEEPADVDKLVEAAYYRLSGGQPNVRVRLTDLRSALPAVPRPVLDAALLNLATQGRAALYGLDNPLEIRPEDREAVPRTPAGDERHIIYLGGPGS